jgi:hypothetical protein
MNRRFFLKALAAIGLMPIPGFAAEPVLIPAIYQTAIGMQGMGHCLTIRYQQRGETKAMVAHCVAWVELSRDQVLTDLSIQASIFLRKIGVKATDIVTVLPGLGDGELVYIKYQEKPHG